MPKSLRSSRQLHLQHLLVEARKANGMTQADVALALQRPQSFVAKYETGERRIDVIEFLDITRVLGVAACEILTKMESKSDGSQG